LGGEQRPDRKKPSRKSTQKMPRLSKYSHNGIAEKPESPPHHSFITPSIAQGATQRISVSLNSDEYGQLKSIADSSQRSLGWVMRHALKRLLEDKNYCGQLELLLGPSEPSGAQAEEDILHGTTSALADFNWHKLRRRTNGTIHSLHPYPTRFSPDLPGRLIEALSKRGQTVLDPLCGSGTAVVEAARRDRHAIGVDISPLATLITRTKCARIREEDRAAVQACVALAKSLIRGAKALPALLSGGGELFDIPMREYCSSAGLDIPHSLAEPGTFPNISRWFSARVILELSLIRTAIERCRLPRARDLLLVSFSSVIVPLSFQSSDTRRARVDRVIAPGEALERWTRKLGEGLELLSREQPTLRWSEVEVHCGDARDLSFLTPGVVDLVVTSPPYPNSYDYRSFQRLRLLWLGLRRECIADVGSPRTIGRDYDRDMSAVLTSVKRVLKSTGLCALVVGRSRIQGQRQDNAAVIYRAAAAAGFRVMGSFEGRGSSTMGSLHMNAAETKKGESVLLLRPQ
jgi:DNA modification methylase